MNGHTYTTFQLRRCRLAREQSHGFTIVELLVVISILGMLAGLLLPAVQYARETARRMQCSNQLKNQTLAVIGYEAAKRHLPPGRDLRHQLEYAWSFQTLPWIEQSSLYSQFDPKKPWDFQTNLIHGRSKLAVYSCPSGRREFDGDTDYAGINGSVIGSNGSESPFDRGVMILIEDKTPILTFANIIDGLSNTLCLSESPDRDAPSGAWVHGSNCISHDQGSVNSTLDGIRSFHGSGANASRVDGSISFLSNSISPEVIAALTTRNGRETVAMD